MLPILYSYDSKGRVKVWRTWNDCDKVIVEAGLQDGKKVHKCYIAKGKNLGKANETTGTEQAILECQSKWNKKKDQDYHENLEESVALENPMLAYPYKAKAHKVAWPAIGQTKLNGVRCLIKRTNDGLIYKSRGNKLYTTLEHLTDSALALLSDLPSGAMLDGEVYIHGVPFNLISSAVKKASELSSKLEFHWYDIAGVDVSYQERLGIMSDAYIKHMAAVSVHIKPTETVSLADVAEKDAYKARCVNRGYEGIMIKSTAGMYRLNTRSDDILKDKPVMDDEFQVIGYNLDKDDLIVLVCKCPNDEVFDVVVKGTHEHRRQILLDYQELWHNKWLKVQFDSYGPNGKPLQAVGIEIRDTDSEGNIL